MRHSRQCCFRVVGDALVLGLSVAFEAVAIHLALHPDLRNSILQAAVAMAPSGSFDPAPPSTVSVGGPTRHKGKG